ncbi:MAG: HTTM domain-containing protein [Chitinophagaceae bacterium]|nr:HTTM domain-containing protein [Chitinophagaceae bacterium]
MFLSILRFWWRGWVTSLYIEPKFHFTYTGFEWVHPPGYWGVHLLFLLVALAAFFITVGFLYRIASIVFFAGFTYIELIDVTTYLNHYYFVSLIAFILIWLPANRNYSLDVLLWPDKTKHFVPASSVGIIRFQLALVYIFAGLAKLNADWLLHAQPMRIWLPAKTHLPIIGIYMYETWVAYLFSWFGAAYDLLIVFFLLNKKTRPWAYCLVVIFHVATAIFFPAIGMFPYVMIICSLIFFSARFHEKLLSFFPFYRSRKEILQTTGYTYRFRYGKVLLVGMGIYIFLQVLIPLRFLLYPGNLFWNEEGYRFSWRVMLMEKSGSTYFTVKDKIHQQSFEVNNAEFLTPLQEKMMSTQPDMILKYAHFLAREYKNRGVQNPEVYGEIYVALNGGRSQLFVDSSINLAAEPLTWKHYEWILPYKK